MKDKQDFIDAMDLRQDLNGHWYVNGTVYGCVKGDVGGSVDGSVWGDVGTVERDVKRNVCGLVYGDVEGGVWLGKQTLCRSQGRRWRMAGQTKMRTTLSDYDKGWTDGRDHSESEFEHHGRLCNVIGGGRWGALKHQIKGIIDILLYGGELRWENYVDAKSKNKTK